MAIVHCIFPFCQAEQTEPSHPASQAARQPARHRAAEPQETEQTEPTAPAQHRQHRQNPASPASVSLGPPGCQAAAESQSHLRDRQRSAESRRFWVPAARMAWPRVCFGFLPPAHRACWRSRVTGSRSRTVAGPCFCGHVLPTGPVPGASLRFGNARALMASRRAEAPARARLHFLHTQSNRLPTRRARADSDRRSRRSSRDGRWIVCRQRLACR